MEIRWPYCPHFDNNLKDVVNSIRNHNDDWFHVGAGDNGSGKSMLSIYGCLKVDPNFNIDRIVFTLPQLKKQIKEIKPGDALLCDEFGDIMFNRDWKTKESRELAKYMMVMRYRRNFIWMNIPKIQYADIYVREGRVSSMTFTYTVDREEKDQKGEIRKYPEKGRFLAYTKKSIINHFERHYYLKPAWRPAERFPFLKNKEFGEDVHHLVELYEAKKDEFGEVKTDKFGEIQDEKP